MNAKRLFNHLFTPDWVARRAFPRATLDRIGLAIKESEKSHDGELRFAVEAGLGTRRAGMASPALLQHNGPVR